VEVDIGDNFSHLERFYQKKICIILYDVLPMFAIGELYKSFLLAGNLSLTVLEYVFYYVAIVGFR